MHEMITKGKLEIGSLQVTNTSKYATQSLQSKSLHETQNVALADRDLWNVWVSMNCQASLSPEGRSPEGERLPWQFMETLIVR